LDYTRIVKTLREGKSFPLLLLHGENSFHLNRLLEEIVRATVPVEARDFNYQVFFAKESRWEDILAAARTFPVFSERRLILVKDIQQFSTSDLEEFLPYIRDPAPETLLLFTADKIDGRKKIFQEFKKKGEILEFRKYYPNQIPSFIQDEARRAGFKLTEEALALFCRRVGTDLQEIHGEMMKLFSYLGGKSLADVEDVNAVVSDTRTDSVFELTDALGRRDVAGAMRLLGRILEEGMAPLLVLNMMVRHFRILWQTNELLEQGEGKDISRRLKISPYFLDKTLQQARRYSSYQYRRIFELFLETDLALKSSGAHASALLQGLISDILTEGRNEKGA